MTTPLWGWVLKYQAGDISMAASKKESLYLIPI
jgi:hypothetical protein